MAPEAKAALELHLLEAGLPGWEEQDRRFVVWLLPEDAPRIAALANLIPGCEVLAETELVDEAWTRSWPPVRVGPFVLSTVGGPEPELAAGETLVRLVPALAFGGGEHPTTRLCLGRLAKMELSFDTRVLDVGSGSGVLSVAAAARFSAVVDAVDVDPTAQSATARAAAATGVAVAVLGAEVPPGRYDLVLANLLNPILIELAPRLSAATDRLLLSGMRAGTEAEVTAAFPGFSISARDEEAGWVALVLERTGSM